MREITLQATNIKEFVNRPITGYYLGSKTFDNEFGESMIHELKLKGGKKDGEHFQFYGFTTMNKKLNLVPLGTLVEITYTGTEKLKTKYGMKDVHMCKVMVDDTKKIELERLPDFNKESTKTAEPQEAVVDDLPF